MFFTQRREDAKLGQVARDLRARGVGTPPRSVRRAMNAVTGGRFGEPSLPSGKEKDDATIRHHRTQAAAADKAADDKATTDKVAADQVAADKAADDKAAAEKALADLTAERDTFKTEVDRLEKLTGKAAKPPAAGSGGDKKLTADEWLADERKKCK